MLLRLKDYEEQTHSDPVSIMLHQLKMLALLFRTRLKLACLNATLERQDHRQVAQLLSSFLDLKDKIVTIGYGDNFKDFEKLEKELQKRIKAKKVLITRGGACICSHTGPDILAISCSN